VLLVLAIVLLAGTGIVLASLLRVRSFAELVLAAYVLAFAEVVVLALLLSLFDGLARGSLVASVALVLVGAVGAALLLGTESRVTRPTRAALRHATGSWPVVTVLTISGLALAYVLALIVGTPPNGWDPLNYHLPRAGLWLEQQQVAYIDWAYDERMNFNPPNAEIAVAFLLGVARHEEVAALVQLAAGLACAVGVLGLARRTGMDARASLFGALLFLLVPIVLLQTATAKNDIVVASLLTAAAVFVLGRTWRELALTGIATCLAVGVKFTAVYGVVLLVLIALVAAPRVAWWRRLCAVGAGAIAGSYWYAVNAVESGMLLGDQTNVPGLTAVLSGPENVVTAFGLLVDFVDLSGAVGDDLFVFVAVALVLAGGFVLAGRGTRAAWVSAAAAGGLVFAALPLHVLANEVARPSLVGLYDALGSPQAYLAEGDEVASSPTTASDTASWFGPAGLFLVVGIAVAAVVLVRRRELPLVGAVTALAPALWLALLAATLTYHPWQGRFFVFPVALSASLWGLTLRAPAIAWALTALAGTTAALSLVHFAEKPSGLRILEREPVRSIWEMRRAEAQSLHDPARAPLLDYVESTVPAGASVALALGANEFGHPFFDPELRRRVALVPWGSTGSEIETDWLVANPERAESVDRACWNERFTSDRGTVFERTEASC
jgi:hypothetical protein